MSNKQQIIGGIAVVAVIALIIIGGQMGYLSAPGRLTGQEAATKGLAYINSTLLAGQATAELSGEVTEEKGIYKFDILFSGQTFTSYITKDGSLLFPEGIVIEDVASSTDVADQPTAAASCEEVAKSDSPVLETFVVSYCPYGLQMQRIVAEVIKGVPQLVSNIKIRYIGAIVDGKITAMHGDEEAQENLRQICLREEQTSKFLPYLSCFMQEGKTDDCLQQEKVDTAKLSACMTDAKRGLAFAQVDFDQQNLYQVTGSPTLLINGKLASEFNFGGRTAQAVKDLACCGFNEKPAFCDTELTTEQAATNFSPIYGSGEASANTSAECQ